MKRIAYLALLKASALSPASTVLNAGDLAVIGYNSSNPDTVAIVALKALQAGTSFTLTDYGWKSEGVLRTGGEGYITATLNLDLALGSVFFIQREVSGQITSSLEASAFSFVWDGGSNPEFAPSAAGDGVILFQGPFDDGTGAVSGNLIYAINADNTAPNVDGWQSTATNSNTSALPTGLVNGKTAIGLAPVTEFDNYIYVGTRTGTVDELLAAIGNLSNWQGRDSTVYSFDTTSFNVVPEPATMALLGLGVLPLIKRRRR